MTDKVVDASAVAAIVYDELDRDLAREMLRDANLFAPHLLDYEMASVCLKKIRLEPTERNSLVAAFARFSALPITRVANDLGETIAPAIEKKTLPPRCQLSLAGAQHERRTHHARQ